MTVNVTFNGPRNCSVRNIVIAFGEGDSYSVIRLPETELNTIQKWTNWASKHDQYGKDVIDAVWLFCQREYGWNT